MWLVFDIKVYENVWIYILKQKTIRLIQGIQFSHIHHFQLFWDKAGDFLFVTKREIEVNDRKAIGKILHVVEDRWMKDMYARKSKF